MAQFDLLLLFFDSFRGFLSSAGFLYSLNVDIFLDSYLMYSNLFRVIKVLCVQEYIVLHLLNWEVDIHVRFWTQVAIHAIVMSLQTL